MVRAAGAVLFILGFLISLSIVGIIIGGPMMLIGFVMMIVGGRRRTVITNVVQVSNNAGAPQLSLDTDGRNQRRYDREPALRSDFAEPPQLTRNRAPPPQISRAPEYEPTYEDEQFTDVRSQLSQDARRILAMAREEGFDVKARPESVSIKKGDYEETFRSNEEVHEFGRARGFQ